MNEQAVREAENGTGYPIHVPCMLIALGIMICGSVNPLLFTSAAGRADHALTTALFWAMSAGFVRGVGFVPRIWIWRWIFSGWACAVGLLLASVIRWAS